MHRYSYGNIVGHGERGAQRSGLGEEIHRHVPLQMEGRNVDVSTVSVQGGVTRADLGRPSSLSSQTPKSAAYLLMCRSLNLGRT